MTPDEKAAALEWFNNYVADTQKDFYNYAHDNNIEISRAVVITPISGTMEHPRRTLRERGDVGGFKGTLGAHRNLEQPMHPERRGNKSPGQESNRQRIGAEGEGEKR